MGLNGTEDNWQDTGPPCTLCLISAEEMRKTRNLVLGVGMDLLISDVIGRRCVDKVGFKAGPSPDLPVC